MKSNGTTILKKRLIPNEKEFDSFFENLNFFKFLNVIFLLLISLMTVTPKNIPIPDPIKSAGNSKIPCGTILFKKSLIPSNGIISPATIPTTKPLRAVKNTGNIPKKTPSVIPINILILLLKNIKRKTLNEFILKIKEK